MYRDGGREELAAKEEAEISVIQSFLPKQMSESEVEDAVRAAITGNRRRLDEGHGKGDGRLKGKICRADGFRRGFRQNQASMVS